VELLIGDYSLAKKELNWMPAMEFKTLVNSMVDHDMSLVERETKFFKEM
jgi:GDP-D-mannose dehydratase